MEKFNNNGNQSGADMDLHGICRKPLCFEAAATTEESNAQVVATRKALYGSIESQIENIIENGLEAEQTRVNQIKADNPKS
jgi:hypothetical protein